MRVLVNYTPRGQKPEDLEKHLNYIMDEKKTLGKYIYCYRCNKEDPLSDMKFVKKLYGKDRGRQYISYMQSFMSYDEVTPEQVMRLGIQMAKFFKDYQSVTCVHVDTDRIHYHTIVNPVNLTNGKKLRLGAKCFYEFWHYGVDVYNEQNLPWEIDDDRIHDWLDYTTRNADAFHEEVVDLAVRIIENSDNGELSLSAGGYFDNGILFHEVPYSEEYDLPEDSGFISPITYFDDEGNVINT